MVVTRPVRPNVAMNAKASGKPAKFEATPLNVMRTGRSHPGNPPSTTAQAKAKPNAAPKMAEAALTSRLIA